MVWAFIGVANVCVEILLIIGFGYCLTWKGAITDKFLPQINAFLLYVSFPCLNLWSIGISLDLRNEEGWKALAAYIMWITIIQVSILIYTRIFCKGDLGEAALLNLLLSANNTVIIGLPIMSATWGSAGRYISLLTAVPLFLQIMPFSIILFEMEKWVITQAATTTTTASSNSLISNTPGANGPGGQDTPNSTIVINKTPPDMGTYGGPTHTPGSEYDDTNTPHGATQAISIVLGGDKTPDSISRPATPPPGISTAHVTADVLHPRSSGLHHQHSHGRLAVSSAGGSPAKMSPLHIDSSATHDMPAGGIHGVGVHSPSTIPAHVLQHGHHRSTSFASLHEQLQQFFQQATELRARRKAKKRKQREAAGVVDIPLPLGPAFHLGEEYLSDSDRPSSHHHDDKTGTSLPTQETSQGQYQPWHDWPWEAWHHLLHISKAGMHRIAESFSFHRSPSGNTRTHHTTHTHQSTSTNGAADGNNHSDKQPTSTDLPPGLPRGHSLSNLNPDHPTVHHHHHHPTHPPRYPVQPPPHHASSVDESADDDVTHGTDQPPASRERQSAAHRSFIRSTKVQHAMKRAVRRHGSILSVAAHFIRNHSRWWQMASIIFRNPMLWSLMLAMVVSLSGLRTYLDPTSSNYVMEMGWLVDTLKLMTGTTVPLALFSNGSFLYGKKFWQGNMKKAMVMVFLKIVVLPALQLACAKACKLATTQAMALVLLAVCPTATTSFVVASQYNHGAEVVTVVTVTLTVLLVPMVLAALNLPKAFGLYDYNLGNFPLP